MDELIERTWLTAKILRWMEAAALAAIVEEAAAALEAAREDARAVYAKIPQLPVKPETCEQATDAFTAFCMAFGEHIDQARGKAGGEVEGG